MTAHSKRSPNPRGSVIVAATFLAFVLWPNAAQSQTGAGVDVLANACPAAWSADRQFSRANALADESQYYLAREAAGLYLDCYHTLTNPYAHDNADFAYLVCLMHSVPPNEGDRFFRMALIVHDGANELAASTNFADVRRLALRLRDTAKKLLGTFPVPAP